MPDEHEVKDEHTEPHADGGEEVSEVVADRCEDGTAGFHVFGLQNQTDRSTCRKRSPR